MSADQAEREAGKRAAARAAAADVPRGARVGLGTGSTVAHLLPALAERDLDLRCVATSPATEEAALALGLRVEPFSALDRLDVAIDGADQVDHEAWLVKGGGGAHTREKVVAVAAARFVVIVSDDKLVERISGPVPLELLDFGLPATLRQLAHATVRDAPRSPDGGVIADLGPAGTIADPAALSAWLAAAPGVVEHGLFPPALVDEVVVGGPGRVRRWAVSRGAQAPYRQ